MNNTVGADPRVCPNPYPRARPATRQTMSFGLEALSADRQAFASPTAGGNPPYIRNTNPAPLRLRGRK